MRLEQYLREKQGIPVDQLSEAISECQPFVNDISKFNQLKFLGSGRKARYPIFKGKVRKDRRPKDTPEEIHDILDNAFKENFGVKARSNSLFCVTGPGTAEMFGEPYMIFPIGKYKTIGSSEVKDLFEYLGGYVYKELGVSAAVVEGDNHTEDTKEKILDLLEINLPSYIKDIYKDDFYMKAASKLRITEKHEIMLVCDEYLAINQQYGEETKRIIKEEYS